jgi:hypothetical protein
MGVLGLEALLNDGVPTGLRPPGLSVSKAAVLVRFLCCKSAPYLPESEVGVSEDCLLPVDLGS